MNLSCLRACPRTWKYRFCLVSPRQEKTSVLEQPPRAWMDNSIEATFLEKRDVYIYQTWNEKRETKKIKGQMKKNEKQMPLGE